MTPWAALGGGILERDTLQRAVLDILPLRIGYEAELVVAGRLKRVARQLKMMAGRVGVVAESLPHPWFLQDQLKTLLVSIEKVVY